MLPVQIVTWQPELLDLKLSKKAEANAVYMERAVDSLKRKGPKINEQLLSPLGGHINLKGDYIFIINRRSVFGKVR